MLLTKLYNQTTSHRPSRSFAPRLFGINHPILEQRFLPGVIMSRSSGWLVSAAAGPSNDSEIDEILVVDSSSVTTYNPYDSDPDDGIDQNFILADDLVTMKAQLNSSTVDGGVFNFIGDHQNKFEGIRTYDDFGTLSSSSSAHASPTFTVSGTNGETSATLKATFTMNYLDAAHTSEGVFTSSPSLLLTSDPITVQVNPTSGASEIYIYDNTGEEQLAIVDGDYNMGSFTYSYEVYFTVSLPYTTTVHGGSSLTESVDYMPLNQYYGPEDCKFLWNFSITTT